MTNNLQLAVKTFMENTQPFEAINLLRQVAFRPGADTQTHLKLESLLLSIENERETNNNAHKASASSSLPRSTEP